jgi:hypothetical protein
MCIANGNQGRAFSKVTRADLNPPYKGLRLRSVFCAFGGVDHLLAKAGIFSGAFFGLDARASGSVKRRCRKIIDERPVPFHSGGRYMTKETQKALAIIIASLGVLVILLFWANHLRPHP